MYQMLIHSDLMEEGAALKDRLISLLPVEITHCQSLEDIQNYLGKKQLQLILFHEQKLLKDHLSCIKTIRHLGYGNGILLSTQEIEVDEDILGLVHRHRLNFIHHPAKDRNLIGLVKKLLIMRSLPQQRYRRYLTKEKAHLETYLSGKVWSTNLYNLSEGGAYCEFESKPQLETGDLVRLRIHLDNVEKQHSVNAKVVWMAKKGHINGGPAAGMMFVKSSEIYQHLMEKM